VWLGLRNGFHTQADAGHDSEAKATWFEVGHAGCWLVPSAWRWEPRTDTFPDDSMQKVVKHIMTLASISPCGGFRWLWRMVTERTS